MPTLVLKFLQICLLVYVFVFCYEWWRPLPFELTATAQVFSVPASGVHFYADTTFTDAKGKRQVNQSIWPHIFSIIENAHHYILLDMFLFNNFQGKIPETTATLSHDLTEKLIAQKKNDGHIAIAVITDPINTVYGGAINSDFESLRSANIPVIETDLNVLLDSNLMWSAFWRSFIGWFGNSTGGFFPHPFQWHGDMVTLRSWLALANVKANHRKILVADTPSPKGSKTTPGKMVTIITSANPHDASSANGNVALQIDDNVWQDVVTNERVVAELSGTAITSYMTTEVNDQKGDVTVMILREEQIKKRALELINRAATGDTLNMAMFYLSDRDIIYALKKASQRKALVTLVLDPNKDAFGFEKNGIPNQPVAKELIDGSDGHINIRWCDTHGEQCHAKMLLGKVGTTTFILLGSANFTRRNIGGYNLEEDAYVESLNVFPAWNDANTYFNNIASNKNATYTTDYLTYKDDTLWKAPLYRIMERTGLSSF